MTPEYLKPPVKNKPPLETGDLPGPPIPYTPGNTHRISNIIRMVMLGAINKIGFYSLTYEGGVVITDDLTGKRYEGSLQNLLKVMDQETGREVQLEVLKNLSREFAKESMSRSPFEEHRKIQRAVEKLLKMPKTSCLEIASEWPFGRLGKYLDKLNLELDLSPGVKAVKVGERTFLVRKVKANQV